MEINIKENSDHPKLAHLHNYHDTHQITVSIPHKDHKNNQNTLNATPAESQSARIVTVGSKKRRINSEVKFIHVCEDNFSSALAIKRVAKIKNVVFRPKLQKFISQQKTRLAALEQTLMLQRQRRLNKEECIKKIQRLMSPTNIKQRNSKKFIRTQEKKIEQNKKFKRVKEKQELTHQQRLAQGILVKKLREQNNGHNLSGIPEHLDQHYTESILQQTNPQSQIPQLFSQPLQQSILEQQTANEAGNQFSKR